MRTVILNQFLSAPEVANEKIISNQFLSAPEIANENIILNHFIKSKFSCKLGVMDVLTAVTSKTVKAGIIGALLLIKAYS